MDKKPDPPCRRGIGETVLAMLAAEREYRDMTDEERHAHIENALKNVHPTLGRKVRAIVKDLEGHGFNPTIGSGWRSPAEQLEIYERGDSTVKFSFHNAVKPDGTAYALAVDIVDARWGWDIPQSHPFWKALGSSAHAHSCVWGGDWKHFVDVAHVQLLENEMLAKVKKGYVPPLT